MAPWLRALAALTEDPSTELSSATTTGGSQPPLCPAPAYPMIWSSAGRQKDRPTHTEKSKIFLKC